MCRTAGSKGGGPSKKEIVAPLSSKRRERTDMETMEMFYQQISSAKKTQDKGGNFICYMGKTKKKRLFLGLV